MSSSGFSATSGSRLFMSIRSAASCGQPRHEICGPRGARTRRLVITPTSPDRSSKSPNGIFDPGDESAAADELSAARQIVGQHAVILQPGDAIANALIRPPGPGPGLRWPVKLQRLGRADQFDPHSLLRVSDDLRRFAGGYHPHADMILLIRRGRNAVHAGGMAEHL